MSQSRIDLLSRHRALILAATNGAAADDPLDSEKDLAAKFLRNGLAVLSFSTIEAFIRERTNEVLAAIDPSTINFTELPDGIQTAATLGALKALNFRAHIEDRNNQSQFVISHSKKIASLGASNFTLSDLSFGHEKSNLSAEDVKKILEAFRIENPWAKIKMVAGTVGFGGAMSYEEEFQNISARRHTAAHTLTAQVTQTDLSNAASSILAIAISFDLIISDCLRLIRSRNRGYLNMGSKYNFNPNGINIARVQHSTGNWKYYLPNRTRALKSSADLESLYTDALIHARQHGIALIQFAANSLPTRWSY
jgi:hypothetical protein